MLGEVSTPVELTVVAPAEKIREKAEGVEVISGGKRNRRHNGGITHEINFFVLTLVLQIELILAAKETEGIMAALTHVCT